MVGTVYQAKITANFRRFQRAIIKKLKGIDITPITIDDATTLSHKSLDEILSPSTDALQSHLDETGNVHLDTATSIGIVGYSDFNDVVGKLVPSGTMPITVIPKIITSVSGNILQLPSVAVMISGTDYIVLDSSIAINVNTLQFLYLVVINDVATYTTLSSLLPDDENTVFLAKVSSTITDISPITRLGFHRLSTVGVGGSIPMTDSDNPILMNWHR